MAEHKVNAVPQGMRSAVPALVCKGASAAIDFYKKAFGATEMMRAPDPSGKLVWHAALAIGDSVVFVNDEFPDMGSHAPHPSNAGVSVWLYLDHVDAAFQRAVDGGAKVTMPMMDMFWGDRMGRVVDPFGHVWVLAQHVKDMTPEEMKKAEEDAAKQWKKGESH